MVACANVWTLAHICAAFRCGKTTSILLFPLNKHFFHSFLRDAEFANFLLPLLWDAEFGLIRYSSFLDYLYEGTFCVKLHTRKAVTMETKGSPSGKWHPKHWESVVLLSTAVKQLGPSLEVNTSFSLFCGFESPIHPHWQIFQKNRMVTSWKNIK